MSWYVFFQHIWTHLRRINLRSSSWWETLRAAPWLYWSTPAGYGTPDLTSVQTGSDVVFIHRVCVFLSRTSIVCSSCRRSPLKSSGPCRRIWASKRRRCRSLKAQRKAFPQVSLCVCGSSAVPRSLLCVWVCWSRHRTQSDQTALTAKDPPLFLSVIY